MTTPDQRRKSVVRYDLDIRLAMDTAMEEAYDFALLRAFRVLSAPKGGPSERSSQS